MTRFNQQFNKLVKVTLSEHQHLQDKTDGDKNTQVLDEPVKSQDFFQDNNAMRKKYTATCNKSRNFLSNTAYVSINKENYYKKNFVFDVYLLLTEI